MPNIGQERERWTRVTHDPPINRGGRLLAAAASDQHRKEPSMKVKTTVKAGTLVWGD
jgi:hypothetical protein